MTPASAAAFGAGSRIESRALRRQSRSASAYASVATMVTCSPEMLIKWLTPVRVKICH
jgi:hypothetical protein